MCYTQCGIGWSAQQTSVVPHSLYNQDQKYPVKVSGYTTHMHTECLMCHLVPVVHTCIQYISVLCRCSAAVVSTSCHLHTTHCITLTWLLPMYTSLHTHSLASQYIYYM